MDTHLNTCLNYVGAVYTSMPVGLQACVVYSFSAVIIVSLVILLARWK